MVASTETASQRPKSEAAGRWSRVRQRMQELGLDALLVADSDDFMRPEGGNVRFLANVAVPVTFGQPITPIVVLPLEGDPALVVPSCGWDCLPGLLAKASWIDHIVSAPSASLMAKVAAMTTGTSASQVTADLVATTLRSKGLTSGRIGLSGGFQGLQETRALLPQAQFESATISDDAGRARDLVEYERARTRSPFEIDCMVRANASIAAGIRALERAVVPGASYAKAQSEIEHSMKMAGAEETLCTGSRGRGPFGTYAPPGWVQGEFAAGDMIAFEMNARVGGYWAQLPRTWVVGRQPTAAQRAQYEVARQAFALMRERLIVGATGAEIFEPAYRLVAAAGYDAFGRFGHCIGVSLQEWFSVFVGERGRVQEGQAVVIHTAAIDPKSGEEVLYGEQFIMCGGRPQPLEGRAATMELQGL